MTQTQTQTFSVPMVEGANRRSLLRALLGEQPIIVCTVLTLLPWMVVIVWTAGVWAFLNFVGYVALVTGAGYGLLHAIRPPLSRGSNALLLSPALGITALCGLFALWLRIGLPLVGCLGIGVALFVPGAVTAWKNRSAWLKETVAYGGILIVFSTLICGIFFLPSARNDAVRRSDGSFNWLYGDTQHFYALAESIREDERPPRTPGTATAPLLYHFGPYVPAAVISRIDGLPLGDALARVTRGASIWALILSTFDLGMLLSLRAARNRFGGIMTVAGLFFYGSPLALFTDERNSSSYVHGAVLFKIPAVGVWADGGPFSHLILGHSLLHGLVAITSIMGVCLCLGGEHQPLRWRCYLFAALPALAAPVNSVAALYCLGIVGILVLWDLRGAFRFSSAVLSMFALFLLSWKIMGYSHSTDAAHSLFRVHPGWQWWMVAGTFIVGLGFRIIAFRWVSFDLTDRLSTLFLATVAGFLLFSVLLQLPGGNEHYGYYFLQCMFSIFAFSQWKSGWWRSERRQCVTDWVRLARNVAVICAGSGLLLGGYSYLRYRHTGIDHFIVKLLATGILAVVLAALFIVLKKRNWYANLASGAVIAVLLLGFAGWIPAWLDFGLGWFRLNVTISAGEVQGLERLHSLSRPGQRFATNKHDLKGTLVPKALSYSYAALAQRPVLLEGYLARGETSLPWFPSLLHDNDLMFTTADPNQLRSIARKWDVHWLVARPGSDISLPRPLPKWLIEEQNTGTLKVYDINN